MSTTVWVRDTNGNTLGQCEIDADHEAIWWEPRVETTPNGIMVTVDVVEMEGDG
jgi:hypothetical protein